MFIEEVGASEQINNINKTRKKSLTPSSESQAVPADKLDIAKSSGFQQVINDIITQTPDIREDKIREISEKVQQNRYYVSSSDIARKIITHEEYDGLRREIFG